MSDPQIVFEDSEILVINKPPGMIVNRSDTARGELTLQDWVEKNIKSQTANLKSMEDKEFVSRSGIVHRLDKDTSGVMLVAKNPGVFQKLKDQFKTRKVKKSYLALAHGHFVKRVGEISAPIDRNPQNRFRFAVIEGGRDATTVYHVISEYRKTPLGSGLPDPKGVSEGWEDEIYTLVSLEPLTGRTHQIRVHLGHLGHPLVGDTLYLGAKTEKKDRLFCPRIFLHAFSIGFFHPGNGGWTKVEVGLPDDLTKVLGYIKTSMS